MEVDVHAVITATLSVHDLHGIATMVSIYDVDDNDSVTSDHSLRLLKIEF
jgi:hypothetical protein